MSEEKPKKKPKVVPYKRRTSEYYKKNSRQAVYLQETRDDKGNVVIPPQARNHGAYMEYIRMHDKLTSDPDYFYQTSDPELIINTVANHGTICRLISHLPQDEQQKILTISTRIRSLSAKTAYQKKVAFGTTVDRSKKKGGDLTKDGIQTNRDHSLFYAERGSELLEYFGRYFTLAEVHRIINNEWGYPININTLKQYRIDNIDKINERQAEFKRDFGDIRLGYKKSRLEELSYLYQTRRDLYSNAKKLDDSKELRAILEQVRKEVEGDSLTINGNLHVQHEIRIQQQINEQLMKGLNIKALIVARVAAKLGLDPLILQYKLINSYYAKFTGFKPADNNILTDEIIYPSALIYDFDQIRIKNAALIAEEAELTEDLTPVIAEEEKSKVIDIKSMIMKKLIENREMNKKTKEIIQIKRIKSDE